MSSNPPGAPNKVKMCALWRKVDRFGKDYYTGPWGEATVIAFSNSYKTEDKHPDLILYLQEKIRSDERDDLKKRTDAKHEDAVPF